MVANMEKSTKLVTASKLIWLWWLQVAKYRSAFKVVPSELSRTSKMLILLMSRIKILIHLKTAFKSLKYHLTLWSKAIYEKISHIHSWITWHIRLGHGILCLGSLNLIQYITHIWTPFKYYISIFFWGGGSEAMLI